MVQLSQGLQKMVTCRCPSSNLGPGRKTESSYSMSAVPIQLNTSANNRQCLCSKDIVNLGKNSYESNTQGVCTLIWFKNNKIARYNELEHYYNHM